MAAPDPATHAPDPPAAPTLPSTVEPRVPAAAPGAPHPVVRWPICLPLAPPGSPGSSARPPAGRPSPIEVAPSVSPPPVAQPAPHAAPAAGRGPAKVATQLQVRVPPAGCAKARAVGAAAVPRAQGSALPPRSLVTVSRKDSDGEVYRRSFGVNSAALDAFYRFIHARHLILCRRYAGLPAPWADDAKLRTMKWCNVFREYDAVSQYLIRDIINPCVPGRPPAGRKAQLAQHRDFFLRTVLFKLYNKPGTWEALERGLPSGRVEEANFDVDLYDEILADWSAATGEALQNPAYYLPAPSREQGAYEGSHSRRRLQLIAYWLEDGVPEQVFDCTCLEEVYEILREWPSVGDFIAYQLALDLNMTPYMHLPVRDFASPGPGARAGIRMLFDPSYLSKQKGHAGASQALPDSAIKAWGRPLMRNLAVHAEARLRRLGLGALVDPREWGARSRRTARVKPLTVVEVEHALCELAKFLRPRPPGGGAVPYDATGAAPGEPKRVTVAMPKRFAA